MKLPEVMGLKSRVSFFAGKSSSSETRDGSYSHSRNTYSDIFILVLKNGSIEPLTKLLKTKSGMRDKYDVVSLWRSDELTLGY